MLTPSSVYHPVAREDIKHTLWQQTLDLGALPPEDDRTLFEQVAPSLAQMLGNAGLGVSQGDLDQWQVRFGWWPERTIPIGPWPVTEGGAVHQVFVTGQVYQRVYRRGELDPFLVACGVTDREGITFFGYPLMVEDGVVGVLFALVPQAQLLTIEQIQLLRFFADRLTQAWTLQHLRAQVNRQEQQLVLHHRQQQTFLERLRNHWQQLNIELRGPLTNMRLAIVLLKQQLDTPYLHILEAETQRQYQIITEMLDSQNLETQLQALQLQPIQVTEILDKVYRRYLPLAQKQKTKLTPNWPVHLPMIESDSDALERAVDEILHTVLTLADTEEVLMTALHAPPWLYLSIHSSPDREPPLVPLEDRLTTAQQTMARLGGKFYTQQNREGGYHALMLPVHNPLLPR